MYQKSYKTTPFYNKFNSDISNIVKSIEQYKKYPENKLSELEEEYAKQEENASNEEEFLIYLQHHYGPRKIEIYEELNIELSKTLKQLYTNFEVTLKDLFCKYDIKNKGIKPMYQPDFEFIKSDLRVEIPPDFENEINELRIKRNEYTHNNIDMTIPHEEMERIILDMAKKIQYFFEKIMAIVYN